MSRPALLIALSLALAPGPLLADKTTVYKSKNADGTSVYSQVETRDARFIKWCRDAYPLHNYRRLAPVMQQLRAIKSEAEIELIRQACRITELGFRRILSRRRGGVAAGPVRSRRAALGEPGRVGGRAARARRALRGPAAQRRVRDPLGTRPALRRQEALDRSSPRLPP